MTSIGDHAFGLCDKLVISCHKDSEIYKYAKGNYLPVITIPATEKPAKKGTTLTVSSKKIKVKVTSSSKKNPTVTVTKITDKNVKKLTIPAAVKVKGVTYKVTAISDKAFKGNKKLTTVTIGSNVVIGGGSVVVKDIPDNSVAVGNPCRVIRAIMEEDTIRWT